MSKEEEKVAFNPFKRSLTNEPHESHIDTEEREKTEDLTSNAVISIPGLLQIPKQEPEKS